MYDPQTQYRGDTYIAQGMNAMSEGVSKGLNDFYANKQKSDSYQAMIPSLVGQKLPDGTPLLSEDEASKAIKGGLGAKEGAIATANARLHNYYLGAQASHTANMADYYGQATQGMKLQNQAVQDAQTKTLANSSKIAAWKAMLAPAGQQGQPTQIAPATPVQPAAPVQPIQQAPVEPPLPTGPGGVPNNLSLYYGQ